MKNEGLINSGETFMEKERNEEKSLIGRSMLKVDAAEKVTGEALYAGDLTV